MRRVRIGDPRVFRVGGKVSNARGAIFADSLEQPARFYRIIYTCFADNEDRFRGGNSRTLDQARPAKSLNERGLKTSGMKERPVVIDGVNRLDNERRAGRRGGGGGSRRREFVTENRAIMAR